MFLACIVALPAFAQDNAAADWPLFRGNSAQSGVAKCALPETLAKLWSFKTEDGIQGSPVIMKDTIFVGALDGNLYALDLATGKKKWAYHGVAMKAAPAVRDGAVYIGDIEGNFHCVDAASGKKRWTLATHGQIASPANFAGDKILFGSYDHHLYCVTTEGKIVWQFKTKEKIHGSPAIVDDHVLVGGCDQSLHVIDLATGNKIATITLGSHCGASVAVRGQHAYIGNMDSKFLALDWKKGEMLWRFEGKRGGAFYSSAAVTDEFVVAGSQDKHVRAWQRTTGKEVWAFATRGRVDSSPVVVGQRVIVGSLDGNLYLLDLAGGGELARFALGPIPGSPAVCSQGIAVATFGGEVHFLGKQ